MAWKKSNYLQDLFYINDIFKRKALEAQLAFECFEFWHHINNGCQLKICLTYSTLFLYHWFAWYTYVRIELSRTDKNYTKLTGRPFIPLMNFVKQLFGRSIALKEEQKIILCKVIPV